jgi:REP-associated tyrosine transposase
VEADTPTRLVRGAQGLAIRVARAINRVVRRRGRVWHGRYHAHVLRAPREVRNAFVYVLQNFRKHLRAVPGIDPRSSARWFAGWRNIPTASLINAPVVAPRTWLARVGWRRHGLLDVREMPRRL